MYSGIDNPSTWLLSRVIAEQAQAKGDARAVSMVNGEFLSYSQLADNAAQVAGMLASMGIGPGDRVAILVPNSLDFIRAWAGLERLGATCVFLNPELMGQFLLHPLRDSEPRVLIVDHSLVRRLAGLGRDLPEFEQILIVGDGEGVSDVGLPFDAWRSAARYEGPFAASTDIAGIMYTSGTTGAPKGVLMPHAHCFLFSLGSVENVGITADDHYYICLPLFHVNALMIQLGAVLIAGATATLAERFSVSSWLNDIRTSGATVTNTLGVINAYMAAQPETPGDRDHRLRLLSTAPNHPDHDRMWRHRFGIREVMSGFGMTECNIPLFVDLKDPRPGTCGKAWAKYFEVEIRDVGTGLPVATGEIGEIVVRPRVGQAFMAGYHNQPEKTVEAWRGLWFHTGDAGRVDKEGNFTFVDRIKDCIRRRGENISAVEIENIMSQLAGVVEVAAYAVPSEAAGSEDEIMLAIIPDPGSPATSASIRSHARDHMPRFAQPRFVEFMKALPKTATEKVKKLELKKAGVTPSTIDLNQID
ncbi:AMP-binding protein [uncultured Sphingomonas sp.]|uniref:AMP-binding protein n=1 Tax=uncultured Sphingomonas sp. TaxID=158754 RepID=UPI0035CBC283